MTDCLSMFSRMFGFRSRCHFSLAAVAFMALGWCSGSWADDTHMVCVAETSDQELSVTLGPSRDVFELQHLNFENGHRISLQWLEQPDRLKTYVYDDSKNRRVMLNSQVYVLGDDFKGTARCGQRVVDARTYSGGFEREVTLQCEWSCGSGVSK